MSKAKTAEQINAEIAALLAQRPKVRKHSAFGDDNHAAIDAQLAVLRDRMSSDALRAAYGDEDSDEFNEHTFTAALSAHDWMTGALAADEDAPAESWS